MDVHVIAADWSTYSEDLRAIRGKVFVEEQKVPQSLEWDGLDEEAHHFLAINSAGLRVGCARLLPTKQIGRMAVVVELRGQGVGDLLLQACIDKAKDLGFHQVFLHAQAQAEGFYRKAGFLPVGTVFMEAGISHQAMEMALPIPFESVQGIDQPRIREAAPDPASEAAELRQFSGESECVSGLRAMLNWPRRTIRIYSQLLDHALFDQEGVVEALSEFVRSGPPSRLQVLIHSNSAVVSRGHRLVELARRLDSKIQIRTVPAELATDRHTAVVCDEQGFFLMPDADNYSALSNRYDPVQASRLAERFDYLWERSKTDPELRTLRL